MVSGGFSSLLFVCVFVLVIISIIAIRITSQKLSRKLNETKLYDETKRALINNLRLKFFDDYKNDSGKNGSDGGGKFTLETSSDKIIDHLLEKPRWKFDKYSDVLGNVHFVDRFPQLSLESLKNITLIDKKKKKKKKKKENEINVVSKSVTERESEESSQRRVNSQNIITSEMLSSREAVTSVLYNDEQRDVVDFLYETLPNGEFRCQFNCDDISPDNEIPEYVSHYDFPWKCFPNPCTAALNKRNFFSSTSTIFRNNDAVYDPKKKRCMCRGLYENDVAQQSIGVSEGKGVCVPKGMVENYNERYEILSLRIPCWNGSDDQRYAHTYPCTDLSGNSESLTMININVRYVESNNHFLETSSSRDDFLSPTNANYANDTNDPYRPMIFNT